jgi:uncharacterized protein involved in exopolysaccharide biosynthesis
VIRITSSQVPDRLVQSNMNQLLTDRINAITQGVLSRSTLTSIIQTHDLYPRDRRRVPMEDVIEKMRSKDIRIGSLSLQQGQNRVGAFPITFQYENRYLAQKVTADIVSKLMNENERETISISQTTTDFLTNEMQQAKAKLEEIEAKVSEFKGRNFASLPDSQQMNLAALNSLDQRVGQLNATLSRINQDKLLMESQLRIQREQLVKATEAATVVGDPTKVYQKSEELARKEREIAAGEQTLTQLRQQYTAEYPEIKRFESMLAVARKQRDDLLKEDEASKKALQAEAGKGNKRVVVTREMQTMEAAIKQIEAMIHGKTLEAQDINNELNRTTAQINSYQAKVLSSPAAQQQYSLLSRDLEQSRATYNALLARQQDSERGTKIIRNKQGESLDLLDPASLPVNPSDPKRTVIIGIGAVVGLLLGVVLSGVREMKDTTLKNLKDVRVYTQLTVLGSVPLLEDDVVVKRRKRMALLSWMTALVVGAIVMAGAVAYYYVTTT